MNRSPLTIVLLCLVGTILWRTMHWYPQLPDRIVLHMNGSGAPDGWTGKSIAAWSLLPMIGLGLSVVLFALAAWMEGSAAYSLHSVNVPDKKRFLALPIEARRTVLMPTAIYLRSVAILILLLFGYILEGLARTSLGTHTHWPAWPVLVFVLIVLLGIVPLQRSTRKAMDRAKLQPSD
ncbi:MAG: DUF1648 domain-containing protein [Flavobacteriales bacterium]|nr:DUF1648 domain-containing protein [Flavobacteriales bacterium]MCB0795668.1 DUF1648 domain-containing protein [Flavobacteriales bacterium]